MADDDQDVGDQDVGKIRKPRPPPAHHDAAAVAAALEEVKTSPTVSVRTAGLVLKIGRNVSYREAVSGGIPAVRVGGQLRVPSRKLLEMLGITSEAA